VKSIFPSATEGRGTLSSPIADKLAKPLECGGLTPFLLRVCRLCQMTTRIVHRRVKHARRRMRRQAAALQQKTCVVTLATQEGGLFARWLRHCPSSCSFNLMFGLTGALCYGLLGSVSF
jgi:hypothetical protein